jgi:hypothetical protein
MGAGEQKEREEGNSQLMPPLCLIFSGHSQEKKRIGSRLGCYCLYVTTFSMFTHMTF